MANNNHHLSTPAFQETLDSACPNCPNLSYHHLSKSSSNLLFSRQMSPEERRGSQQELRKSLSGTICHSQGSDRPVRWSPHSEWVLAQDKGVASCWPVRLAGDQLLMENAQRKPVAANYFLTMDQFTILGEEKDIRIQDQKSAAKNVCSGVGPENMGKAHSREATKETEAVVKKSHSGLFCACKESQHINSSVAKEGQWYNKANHQAAPRYQKNMIKLMTLTRDQNMSPTGLDSEAIHNFNAYTVPETFHHTESDQLSANGFPDEWLMDNKIPYHSQYDRSCDIISCAMNSSATLTISNSCVLPGNTRHEPSLQSAGTVPACCHSMPIPAIPLSPKLVCTSKMSGRGQSTPGYCPQLPSSSIMTFPKLASSVSESRLDAKWLMKCGTIPGNISPLPYQEGSCHTISELNINEKPIKASCTVLNEQTCMAMSPNTKETGTMTMEPNLPLECKDAEVQTVTTTENKSVVTSPSFLVDEHAHLFPKVCLDVSLHCPPSPVQNVRWDEEGMTWEVYGASVDPEVLGLAIQKHLEIQIEQQIGPPELSKQTSNEQSSKEEKTRPFRAILTSLKNRSCCIRSSTLIE